MANVPIVVLAGHSNAAVSGVDNHLVELLGEGAFEFVKVAEGGTSMFPNAGRDWSPSSSGELFDALVAATNAAIANVIAQGDTPVVSLLWINDRDKQQPHDQQLATLTGFIEQFRDATGQADAHVSLVLCPSAGSLRDAQFEVASALDNVDTLETNDLTTGPDGVHWDHDGREVVAERFFASAAVVVPGDPDYDNLLDAGSYARVSGRVEATAPQFEDYRLLWTKGQVSVRSFSGDDRIKTGAFNDVINTGGNNDRINAGAGNDMIIAGAHDDFIRAGDGKDIITGGTGRDTIYGEGGADRFVFDIGDSDGSRAWADRIMDFGAGDVIDLRGEGLHFIAGRFTGVAGELHVIEGRNSIVEVDVDGDRHADFTLVLTGAHGLDAGAFLL